MMETVAFYSYKGGVGRTLLIAITAQLLAKSGRRVVALDLDLEAPGLSQKLGKQDGLPESGALIGAVDALLGILATESGNESLRQAAVKIALPPGTEGSLVLIPAGSAPSPAYWSALERLTNSLRSDDRASGLVEALLELQARIATEFSPDFLLIDSRSGITELGGLATSLLADRVVCLTTTATESIEGTRVVAAALREAPRLSSQQPLRIEFLITRLAPGARSSATASRLIEELGDNVAVLPQDSSIADDERMLSDWMLGHYPMQDDDAGKDLFYATLDWISKAFPGRQEEADAAKPIPTHVPYPHTSYLDASALVKAVLYDEEGSEKLRGYLRSINDFHVTPVCFVEALGVLKKKKEKKKISSADYFDKCEELVGVLKRVSVKGFSPHDEPAFQRAIELARKHDLDVSDALQLVTILDGPDRGRRSKTMLVTADGGLARAAKEEGIRAWDLMSSDSPPEV